MRLYAHALRSQRVPLERNGHSVRLQHTNLTWSIRHSLLFSYVYSPFALLVAWR
jgi:hypothetical protein